MSCPDCFRGSVHEHASPTGHFETLHGWRTYVAGPADAASTILYLPDAFGLKLVNNKLLADRYAAGTGCRVLVPDLQWRGGAEPSCMDEVERLMTPGTPFLARLWCLLWVVPAVLPFSVFGAAPTAYPAVLAYARAARAALPPGGRLGVAGFCWGGYGSTRLCAETARADGGGGRLVDAQFCGHPSQLKTPDMVVDAVAAGVPYSCAVAQMDLRLSEEIALEVEAAVRQRVGPPSEACDYEFVVYKDCVHGFCVRATPGTKGMEGYHGAAKQAVDWFNKYLH